MASEYTTFCAASSVGRLNCRFGPNGSRASGERLPQAITGPAGGRPAVREMQTYQISPTVYPSGNGSVGSTT